MYHRISHLVLTVVLALSLLLLFHVQVEAYTYPTFSNSTTITVNDSPSFGTPGLAALYPSTISVSGVLGSITKVTVTLNGLTHPTVGDFDVVLVGPTGEASVLMSDIGGASPVTNITFTLDQTGASLPSPPANGGVYKPRESTSTSRCAPDSFPAPGPASIPSANLDNFNGLSGSSVNGTWSLYIVDDCKDNTGSLSGGWSLTIATNAVAPLITSAAPSNGTVGAGYSHTYSATGDAPITFSLTSGSLPPGLSLSSGGLLSGTPSTAGSYSGVVTASNGVLPDATQAFNITISPAPVAPLITSAAPSNGTVGAGYSHTYSATGDAPIAFSLTSGSLPPGLSLSSGGLLSGTPSTAGSYSGVVTASNGVLPDATQAFNITISPASTAPFITSAAPSNGTVGAGYSHTYSATGDAPITFSLTSGSLPPDLTLSSDGLLSGTPTTAGSYSGVVTASNGILPDATQAFSITITTTLPPNNSTEHPYVATAADHARAQAPLCADVTGKSNAVIRASVNAGTVTDGSVFCRVLAENGSFLVDPAQIGNTQVLTQSVIQAVDVFGLMHNGAPQAHFNSLVQSCLQGSGVVLFLDATNSPRTVTQLPAWLDGGYTCANIPSAGIVLLVQGAGPTAPAPAPNVTAQGLGNCTVTTNYIVNLRTEADGNATVLSMVPYNVTLTAFQRQGDWFYIDYLGARGWVNATLVSPNGTCE